MSTLNKQRGPITLAAAEAEQDRLFDRPPRPMSLALRRLLQQIAQQDAARPAQKRRAA